MKNIAILGSTGSIGTQTLDVARKNEDIRVYMSQSKAEEILCAYPYFLVCTKGIIVNLYEVENLKKDQIHLTGGITLPVSRRRAKDVQDQFATFTFDRMRREADF